MKLFNTYIEYENRFAFISEDSNFVLLEKRNSPISVKELAQKNIVILCSEGYLKDFARCRRNAQIFRNDKGRILDVVYKNKVLKNFNALSGYIDFEVLKRDFEFRGETQSELMKEYVEFLRKVGLSCSQIAMFSRSGIAECVFYKKTGQLFKISNNALPKTEEERKAVFEYYKKRLIEKNGMIYGKLQHEKGQFNDVFMIDINNFYGFVLIAEEFLLNNPYQVLFSEHAKKEPQYGHLPDEFRNAICHNYKTAKFSVKTRGEKLFFKGCNNLTLGRSENFGIYKSRTRQMARNFLQPQHGFYTIEAGISYLETYMNLFEKHGAKIVKVDTDGISMTNIDYEKGKAIVDKINQAVVNILRKAGNSEENCTCGIGQFKIEGFAERYYQFADKAYCYEEKGRITIKFSGMSDAKKKEIIEQCKTFDNVVEELMKYDPCVCAPVCVNDRFEISFNKKEDFA